MSLSAAALGVDVPAFAQESRRSVRWRRQPELPMRGTARRRHSGCTKWSPRNEVDHTTAMLLVQEAEQAVANNDQKGSWDALSKTRPTPASTASVR